YLCCRVRGCYRSAAGRCIHDVPATSGATSAAGVIALGDPLRTEVFDAREAERFQSRAQIVGLEVRDKRLADARHPRRARLVTGARFRIERLRRVAVI